MTDKTSPKATDAPSPRTQRDKVSHIVRPGVWGWIHVVSSEPVTQEMIDNFKPVVTNARQPFVPRSRRRTEKDPEG